MSESGNGRARDLLRWQVRIFSAVWVTYFAYYMCRLNMTMAKGRVCEAFSWDASQIGMVFSALTVAYAVGQFINGQLADRFGGRLIASVGVLGSVAMNLAIFAVTLLVAPVKANHHYALVLFVAFWGANGFFQAMGWTPMVRIMAHWFPICGRGKVMGWLGACYQLGGAFAWLLAGFLTGYYVAELRGDWRAVFWVPAVLFAAVGIFFFLRIRNSPEDVDLPPVNPDDTSENPGALGQPAARRTIVQNVVKTLTNPYVWIVGGTFLLLDINRYGFLNWLPDYLHVRGADMKVAKFSIIETIKPLLHPLAGSAGAVIAGWATDRFFGGRRAPVIALLLAALGGLTIIFPFMSHQNPRLVILVVALIGFCTYGPHILMVGHAAQDFGKKAGAAGAAGFIDGLGYIGASLAGWGAGWVIKSWNYEVAFVLFGVAAFAGALLVCVIWKTKPGEH